jgi:hypothetical protein
VVGHVAAGGLAWGGNLRQARFQDGMPCGGVRQHLAPSTVVAMCREVDPVIQLLHPPVAGLLPCAPGTRSIYHAGYVMLCEWYCQTAWVKSCRIPIGGRRHTP